MAAVVKSQTQTIFDCMNGVVPDIQEIVLSKVGALSLYNMALTSEKLRVISLNVLKWRKLTVRIYMEGKRICMLVKDQKDSDRNEEIKFGDLDWRNWCHLSRILRQLAIYATVTEVRMEKKERSYYGTEWTTTSLYEIIDITRKKLARLGIENEKEEFPLLNHKYCRNCYANRQKYMNRWSGKLTGMLQMYKKMENLLFTVGIPVVLGTVHVISAVGPNVLEFQVVRKYRRCFDKWLAEMSVELSELKSTIREDTVEDGADSTRIRMMFPKEGEKK